MTLTPVTISIILNGSQLDARSLIQAERNEETFKRIEKTRKQSEPAHISQDNVVR